jgi:hypothetical protein
MEIHKVKKYEGKKVYIILKNGFRYTCVIPEGITDSFTIVDKFGNEMELSCDYVAFIREVDGE